MRIAIYSRGLESEQLEGLKVLLNEFSNYNIEPVIYQDFFNQFYSSIHITDKYSTFNCSEDLDEIDFIISLGGVMELYLTPSLLLKIREFRFWESIMEGLGF